MLNDDFDIRDDDLDTDDAPRAPQYYTVRVYLQELSYGGPEEGGWWYTAGEFAREFGHLTRSFKERWEALKYANDLHETTIDGLNKRRPPLSSVLSQGVFEAKVWDEEAPLSYPATKPHYE